MSEGEGARGPSGIVDCRCRAFTRQVIRNATSRTALVEEIRLGRDGEDPAGHDGSNW